MAAPTILQTILERKAEEVAAGLKRKSLAAQEDAARDAGPVRGFHAAIEAKIAAGKPESIGTVTLLKSRYGLVADETVEDEAIVFARRPDIYE